MANPFFQFKQFTVAHDRCAMKVTTDACLFGAWVAAQLEGRSGSLLDIGTGTCLLALMVAQKAPLQIDAVEIDESAALQAAENCSSTPFEKVRIIRGDIRSLDLQRYDFIISNPPFYEKEIESADPRKRRAHHSGGLSWAELFEALDRLIKPGGTVFLLLPAKRRKDLDACLRKTELHIHQIVEVQPSLRHASSRLLLALGCEARAPVTEQLLIADERGYTPRFSALLCDYYLNL
ncbi:MAG: methyltransferase domain-containing protein [Chitinophagaceae bacterium]|nr:MAG: methyltransferase domain-containing protein [Chitinophagaceae bacterium]